MSNDYYACERLLYPEFREVRPELIVNCEKTLRLRRESVTTSGKSLFLIDSIRHLVLYRSPSPPSLPLSLPPPLTRLRSFPSQSLEASSPAYKPDELSSPEKYFVDSEENPVLRDGSWIVNDLARRLRINPLTPKIYLADAGRLSSGSFNEMLLEEHCSVPGGYQAFLERLTLDLSDSLVTVPTAP